MGELTPRQQRFVQEYATLRNGAQAALRAGYSPNCARETAYRLLTNDHIRAALNRELSDTANRLRIERDDVIRGLLEAAYDAQYYADVPAAIDAWCEIAIMLGYYPLDRRAARTSDP